MHTPSIFKPCFCLIRTIILLIKKVGMAENFHVTKHIARTPSLALDPDLNIRECVSTLYVGLTPKNKRSLEITYPAQ